MELQNLSKLTAEMIENLPEPGNCVEEVYADIVRKLQREIIDFKNVSSSSYQEMMDYYTVWVHQIKTPISSMRLTLDNLDTEEGRRLRADLFRLCQYVDMVLAYLRLDSTSKDYVFKEYKLHDILSVSIKKFSQEFIGRHLSLSYEPIDTVVLTDEKWFSFMFEQILSNALKYTKEGGISIFMADEKTLVIKDTGIGIEESDLPRIFEKGFTGFNGRSNREASGLGLFLCRRICNNLGISISAESTVGVGTSIILKSNQKKMRHE